MPSLQQLSAVIDQALATPLRVDRLRFGKLLQAYARTVRRVNGRLRLCAEFVKHNEPGDAVIEAERQPRLLDLVAGLNAVQRPEVSQYLAKFGFELPGALWTDATADVVWAYGAVGAPLPASHTAAAVKHAWPRPAEFALIREAEDEPADEFTEALFAGVLQSQAEADAAARSHNRQLEAEHAQFLAKARLFTEARSTATRNRVLIAAGCVLLLTPIIVGAWSKIRTHSVLSARLGAMQKLINDEQFTAAETQWSAFQAEYPVESRSTESLSLSRDLKARKQQSSERQEHERHERFVARFEEMTSEADLTSIPLEALRDSQTALQESLRPLAKTDEERKQLAAFERALNIELKRRTTPSQPLAAQSASPAKPATVATAPVPLIPKTAIATGPAVDPFRGLKALKHEQHWYLDLPAPPSQSMSSLGDSVKPQTLLELPLPAGSQLTLELDDAQPRRGGIALRLQTQGNAWQVIAVNQDDSLIASTPPTLATFRHHEGVLQFQWIGNHPHQAWLRRCTLVFVVGSERSEPIPLRKAIPEQTFAFSQQHSTGILELTEFSGGENVAVEVIPVALAKVYQSTERGFQLPTERSDELLLPLRLSAGERGKTTLRLGPAASSASDLATALDFPVIEVDVSLHRDGDQTALHWQGFVIQLRWDEKSKRVVEIRERLTPGTIKDLGTTGRLTSNFRRESLLRTKNSDEQKATIARQKALIDQWKSQQSSSSSSTPSLPPISLTTPITTAQARIDANQELIVFYERQVERNERYLELLSAARGLNLVQCQVRIIEN